MSFPSLVLMLELCHSASRKAATREYLRLKLAAVEEREAGLSSPVCSIRNSLAAVELLWASSRQGNFSAGLGPNCL